jgi:hypothetical protein
MTSVLQTEPTKVCSTCKEEKDVATNFHKNKNYRGGYTAQCKVCRLAAIKIWRKNNRDKVRAINKRYYATDKGKALWKRERIKHAERRRKYIAGWRERNPHVIAKHALNRRLKQRKMTQEQYDALVKKQNNLCAVCGQPEREGEQLAIDHCHKTDKNRGLLCERHNMMMGLAGDSPEILRKAAAYLEEYAVESGIS